MHVVDISALYSPNGGGIRTYTERKLRMAADYGVRLTVVAPGPEDGIREFGPARLVMVRSPRFPLDRNYCHFADHRVIHQALDALAPDFVECSSPWGSARAVADWPGTAPRALVMHAEPMSAWVYRYLDGWFTRSTIDHQFEWFWRYLRGLDARFDLVVTAAPSVTLRLKQHGLHHLVEAPLGVEGGVFSPTLRDNGLRAALLAECSLPAEATLALAIGRLSPEKQWPLVIAGVAAAGHQLPIGLVLLGDGHGRAAVERAIAGNPHIRILPPLVDRGAYARTLASSDLLIHGCAAETFGLACAEATASGLPMIVPDEGGAGDQLAHGCGLAYRAGDVTSLAAAIIAAAPRLVEWQAIAGSRAAAVPTMAAHFEALFSRYRTVKAQAQAA